MKSAAASDVEQKLRAQMQAAQAAAMQAQQAQQAPNSFGGMNPAQMQQIAAAISAGYNPYAAAPAAEGKGAAADAPDAKRFKVEDRAGHAG